MTNKVPNLQKELKAHTLWLSWKLWDAADKETRGEEPPKGSRVDLEGAYLEGANLVGVNLVGVNLVGANLEGANLRGAHLRYTDLRGANLIGANLRGAHLMRVNLEGANLVGANLEGAYLRSANLIGAKLPNGIPVIPDIDTKIHEAVKMCGLQMSDWHCGTTHCRAGWAIHLAGEEGYVLEEKLGSQVAGTLIYMASRPDKKHPDFFCSSDEALASIEEDAKGDKDD